MEKAVTFLLHFGGGELYIRRRDFDGTELAAVVGIEGAIALGKIAEDLPRCVPLGKPWLAAVWAARGESVAQIARTLRASDVAAKRWLAPAKPKGTAPDCGET